MKNNKNDEYNLISYWWIFLLIFIFWLGFMALMFWSANDFEFDLSPSTPLNSLGVFGDSFNILTSLFTGLAFAGLIISVELQRKELKATREELNGQKEALEKQKEEMEQQSFDNRFFQMLNSFNELRDEYFKEKYPLKSISSSHGVNLFKSKEDFLFNIILCRRLNESTNNILDDFYTSFYNEIYINSELNIYFLNLYQILKYVDKSYENTIENAKFYTNILRAQLCQEELIILLFNAHYLQEKNNDKKYINLIEKYALFKHLNFLQYYQKSISTKSIINYRCREKINQILATYTVKSFRGNSEMEKIMKSLFDVNVG